MRFVSLALASVLAAGCIDLDDGTTSDEQDLTTCPQISISLSSIASPATLDLSTYYIDHPSCASPIPVKVTPGSRAWDWTATWAGSSLIGNSARCTAATVVGDVKVPSANGAVQLPFDHASAHGLPVGTSLCIVPVARSTKPIGATASTPNPSNTYYFTLDAHVHDDFALPVYEGLKLKLTAR